MSGLESLIIGTDLEALDEFLRSDRSPPQCLQLSDLDGFLTAIAVGPELVMPSEWLPAIWGDEAQSFADEAETRAVVGTILGRYNEIVRQVEDGSVEPIFWNGPDGTVVATDWADGFGLAMALRSQAWEPLVSSKRYAQLLVPILILCDPGEDPVEVPREVESKIMEEAPGLIPECIMGIAAFWRERHLGGAKQARPGRNDRCACGSGKKFKHCCGRR